MIGKFNEDEYLKYRVNPNITIEKSQFENMKEQLSLVVNMNTTGLDDLTIKRMLLSYYRGVYLSDTNILIELNKDNDDEMEKARKLANNGYYQIVNGDTEEGKGTDGNKYLQTKGIVNIKQLNKDDTLFYCSYEGLKKIYQEEYLPNIPKDEKDDGDYARSVKNYLKKCYTYYSERADEPAEMKMYAFTENSISKEYKYENNDSITWTEKDSQDGTATLQTVDFNTEITQFLTPIEFFVDLMEITGSNDFINAVMDMLNSEESIVLQLYEVKNTTTTNTKREYTQDTLVKGEKGEDKTYQVKKADGTIISHTVEEIEGTNEVNITVNSSGEDCKVTLYTNDSPETTTTEWKEGTVTHTTTVTKTWDLNESNNWTKTWTNKIITDKVIKEKMDTSKVTVTTRERTEIPKYEIGIKEVNVWYGSIKIEGTSKNTTTIKYTKDENGNYEEILEDKSKKTLNMDDESDVNYLKSSNPEIFINRDVHMALNETEYINAIFNHTIRKEALVEGFNYKEYDFNELNISKKDITESFIETQERETLDIGVTKQVDKTESFLGLLSNDTGTYYKGAKFKSKNLGGIVVRYHDLYGKETTVGAGELLENGAEVLFELLNSSENTKSLVNIMRYIMWLYSGKTIDYGVTELEFAEYDIDNMKLISNNSGFWWPIGSGNSSTQDTKDDVPVDTTITSGVGPRWGKNHGGIDISGSFSIPGPYIIASDSGVVKFATQGGGIYDTGYYGSNDGGGYGNYIIIDHGNGYETYYAHLYKGSITVNIGDTVEKGQVIGKMGSSGSSTGVHLHFEVRLNGNRMDPEEYVSKENPRPNGIGGISQELYNFILAFEGGKSYFNQSNGEYTVFNNGLDGNLELTCGVAIGTKTGGLYDYVKDILGRTVTIGSTITGEEYNEIFSNVAQSKMSIVDNAIASTGVTLTQAQKDAVYSLCWNASNASKTIKEALTKFKNNGEKGYWEYIHDYTNNGLTGLVRRRAEEFELFINNDYSVGNVDYGLDKHKEYNRKYGFAENEGG